MRHHHRPTFRILGAAVALLLAGAGPGSSPADLEALIKEGKLDDAISSGRPVVKARPSDPDLHVALAHALAAKGRSVRRVLATTVNAEDLVAGKVALPRISADNPPKIEIHYDPALFEEALGHVRAAVKLAPERKDLRLTECYLLTDAGDVDGATAAVRETLGALPHTPALSTDLAAFGVERAKRGDPRGGSTLLQPVSKAFPGDASLAADYGYILAQAGRKAEALTELDRAAGLASRDLRVERRRTAALMLLREFKRARAGWQAAVEAGHEDGDRLGAAAAAIASDLKTAKSELQELATPAASADQALVDLAADLLRSASAPAASKENIALAKKLADDKKELLALPILHRALRANPQLKEAAALLAGIERAFGFESASEQILRDALAPAAPPAKPTPKSSSGAQTSGASRR